MNKKIRANAAWNGLSDEQRGTLERWLFKENLGFAQALERARKELGFAGSMASLQRFYHRRAESRMLDELAADAGGPDEKTARSAGMRAVGRIFLKQVTDNPDAAKEWTGLAKLLLHSEENELRRAAEAEKNEIWRNGLALAREKFEFDAAEAALKQLANSADLDAEELAREKARVLAIRKRLFGRDLPEVRPGGHEGQGADTGEPEGTVNE